MQTFHSLRASLDMVLEPCLAKLPPMQVYVWMTVVFVAISGGIGIAIPNVTTVLGYKGAVLGSQIVYIFPALMYWVVLAHRNRASPKCELGDLGL